MVSLAQPGDVIVDFCAGGVSVLLRHSTLSRDGIKFYSEILPFFIGGLRFYSKTLLCVEVG